MSSIHLSRGSQWRKWDLHVHTPESIYHRFGSDDDVWEKYITDLEQLPNEFSVLGINDYLFIDGYEKLIHEKQANGRLKNIDLLLPVIEFRIDKFAGVDFGSLKRINLHVIFSNEITIETIKSQFLNTLEQHYHVTDKGAWTRAITKLSVEELGKEIKSSVPTGELSNYGSDLEEGFNNLNVSEDEIYKSLKKDCFEGKYLIAIGKTEWDQLKWTDASIATKKSVINRPDIVFTAASSVEAFDKAKSNLTSQGVNNLLLDCSDAHYLSQSEDKDRIGNCFTWIKADPTFEGLKQILYEPEDRICIQEGLPEEKNDYHVIESIQFIDDNFLPEIIPLNQNLTTIIGGKSTGKSLLLRSIAKTIDPEEVSRRLKEVKLEDYTDSISGFSVKWRDRQEQTSGSDSTSNKKIIYIPQSYLNRLVDLKEENSSIDEIIKNVLLQTDEVKNAYQTLEQQSREIHQKLSKEVDNLFFYLEDWREKTKTIKEIGDKKGVEEEIKKLNIEVQELKRKSGMTDAEIESYNTLRLAINLTTENIEKTSLDISALEEAKKQELLRDPVIKLSTISVQSIIDTKYEILKEEFRLKWSALLSEQINSLKVIHSELQIERVKNAEIIKPHLDKIKDANLLNEKAKKYDIESEKLKKIIKEEQVINEIANKYHASKAEIASFHSKYYQLMFNAKTKILDQQIIGDELNFDLKIAFKTNAFQSSFINQICDLRKLNGYTEINLTNYEYLNHTAFEKNIQDIIHAIIGEAITLKGNYTPKEAIRKLLENWYIFDYIITHNGDILSKMSPGKKSFVLLKLLIELDNSKCPILIDQPEDDLDNRSIYFDLVSFIKSKKKERQIIVATHNPNLVVSADAEEVIVANRRGEQTPNNRYEFEYMSGALENSKELDSTITYTLGTQGIQQHVCDILEGGKSAFKKRSKKYNITT